MIDNAKITIIMPVYNGEKYLKKAIDSILCQTYKNFILCIINDGSTDYSEEIILKYDDERILYLKNERNLGIVKTLNKGLSFANTKYIARMDSDDICDERRLELQLNEFEKDENLVLLGTHADLIDENGVVIGHLQPPVEDVEIRTSLLFSNVFVHSSIMIRNSILKEERWEYDINHKAVEDYGLWLKVSSKYKTKNLPVKLMKYRINTEGITAKANTDQLELIKNHSIIYKEYLERNDINVSNKLLIEYTLFLKGCCNLDVNLLAINNLIDEVKNKIISKLYYDEEIFESILSGVSRGYAINNKMTIRKYYNFISFNYILSRPVFETVKFVFSKIKNI